MIHSILHKYLHHRHPWRLAKFNELNEIYVVMLVRGLSLSMMGIFIPIFMYRSNYGLDSILTLFAIFFGTRLFTDTITAFLVARFGPKHILVFGQILFIVTSALFLTLNNYNWPLLLVGFIWGFSQSCYYVAFGVDFSKIKHNSHSGRELGYATIMAKLGSFIGPIMGGLVGYFLGGQYIFLFASVLMMLGMMPLFKTREPVRVHQKLDYEGFEFKKTTKLIPSMMAVNVDQAISTLIWPLFLAMFVLPGKSVFIKIGLITSISIAISIFSSHSFGKISDGKNGRKLLVISAVSNALIHLFRPFVSLYSTAFAVNVANDTATLGYRFPFFKGYFDSADKFAEHRIIYISIMETFGNMAKLAATCILLVITAWFSDRATLNMAFVIAAISSLFILSEKLTKRSSNG